MPGHQEFSSLLPFLFSLFISFSLTVSKGALRLHPAGSSPVQHRDRSQPHAHTSTRSPAYLYGLPRSLLPFFFIPPLQFTFEHYWLNLQFTREPPQFSRTVRAGTLPVMYTVCIYILLAVWGNLPCCVRLSAFDVRKQSSFLVVTISFCSFRIINCAASNLVVKISDLWTCLL